MKTLYISRNGERAVLNEVLLADIDEAAADVYALALKKNWWPQIDLHLKDYGCGNSDLVISVRTKIEDQNSVDFIFGGRGLMKTSEDPVQVRIGKYDKNAWTNSMAFSDIRDVPDIHFSEEFLTIFIHPQDYDYLPFDVIEMHHRKTFAFGLDKHARGYIEPKEADTQPKPLVWKKRITQKKAYIDQLLMAVNEFYSDRKPFENLIETVTSEKGRGNAD